MKAVQISRFGGPEVLQLVEVPTPIPAAGQVLVRLRAIGVNLADTLTRMDRYAVTPPIAGHSRRRGRGRGGGRCGGR